MPTVAVLELRELSVRSSPTSPLGQWLALVRLSPLLPKPFVFLFLISGGASRTVAFTLSTVVSTTYQCSWNGTTAPGSVVGSEVRCIAPTLTKGMYEVKIVVGSKSYAPPANMEFFDCATTSSCQACTADERAQACKWCTSSLSCLPASDISCTNATNTCPGILDWSPKAWNMDNMAYPPINLVVSDYQTNTFECHWTFSNGTAMSLPAQFHNSSSIDCNFPVGAVRFPFCWFDRRFLPVLVSLAHWCEYIPSVYWPSSLLGNQTTHIVPLYRAKWLRHMLRIL